MCRVSTIGLHRLCRFFSPRFHRLIRHVEQFGSIDSHIKAVALVSIWISPRDFHCQFRKSSTDSIGAVWHGADNGVPNRCNSAPRRTIMILPVHQLIPCIGTPRVLNLEYLSQQCYMYRTMNEACFAHFISELVKEDSYGHEKYRGGRPAAD